MSGLINSAGSRSGVLGTTELDYEEGTWTAGMSDGSTSLTMNGSFVTGYYTKIGNLVTVSGFFRTTGLNGLTSEAIRITGLPFDVATGSSAYSGGGAAYGESLNIPANSSISFNTAVGDSFIYLQLWDDAGGSSGLTASEWSADGSIQLGFTYRAG